MDIDELMKKIPLLYLLRIRLTFPVLVLLVLGFFAYPNIHNEADLFRLALRANGGELRAQVQMGVVYALGRGVEQDIDEAVSWWKSAAENGLRSLLDWVKRNSEEKRAQIQVNGQCQPAFVFDAAPLRTSYSS